MANIICIANQKGGVGKTTTAINLSAALAISGRKTLIVDCDPQGNATTGLGIDKTPLEYTLYHGLIGEASGADIVLDTEMEGLALMPSRVELIGFDVEMMDDPRRNSALQSLLAQVTDRFDFIVLDCPPALSLLTVNAMCAADQMLVPLQCEFYALEGLGQLMQTIQRIRSGPNPGLGILGILLTMYDQRTNLGQQVAAEANTHFKDLVFKTKIPRNVRLAEAPSFGRPVLLHDAASVGAVRYLDLAGEILEKL